MSNMGGGGGGGMEAPMSIRGEMWYCGDSQKPSKNGAGRGLKNYITIERDRFVVYSARSEHSKQIKEIAFRSIKRIAWFTHNPKAPETAAPGSMGAAAVAARRRPGREATNPQAVPYYYLVIEFLRDNVAQTSLLLGKRERVVLCTDDVPDFNTWKKFVDLYECPPLHPRYYTLQQQQQQQQQQQPQLRGRKGEPTGGAPDHDDTTSEDEGRGSAADRDGVRHLLGDLQLWRHRAIALANDLACMTDPKLQIKDEESFLHDSHSDHAAANLWEQHTERLLRTVEKDLKPAEKALPPTAGAGAEIKTASASTSSGPAVLVAADEEVQKELNLFRSTSYTAATLLRGTQPEKALPEFTAADMQHVIEAITSVGPWDRTPPGRPLKGREADKTASATIGALQDALNEWNELYNSISGSTEAVDMSGGPKTRDQQSVRVQFFEERMRSASQLAERAKSLEEQAKFYITLKSVCSEFLEAYAHHSSTCVGTPGALGTAVDAAFTKAPLADKTRLAGSSLIEDSAQQRATVASLTEAAGASSALVERHHQELSSLKKQLNRKTMDLEQEEQKSFEMARHAKHLERLCDSALQEYAAACEESLRSEYSAFAEVRLLFLSIIRGDVEHYPAPLSTRETSVPPDSAGTSPRRKSMPKAAPGKLVVSTAHMEAIQALELERQAARQRQRELDAVMEELEALRQERDSEMAELKANFLAAKAAWQGDTEVLQAKLAAVQRTLPHAAVILPVGDKAHVRSLDDMEVAGSTAFEAESSSGPMGADDVILLWANRLAVGMSESDVGDYTVAGRLKRFYTWALEVIAPLNASNLSTCVLDMVVQAVQGYVQLLHDADALLREEDASAALDVIPAMRRLQERNTALEASERQLGTMNAALETIKSSIEDLTRCLGATQASTGVGSGDVVEDQVCRQVSCVKGDASDLSLALQSALDYSNESTATATTPSLFPLCRSAIDALEQLHAQVAESTEKTSSLSDEVAKLKVSLAEKDGEISAGLERHQEALTTIETMRASTEQLRQQVDTNTERETVLTALVGEDLPSLSLTDLTSMQRNDSTSRKEVLKCVRDAAELLGVEGTDDNVCSLHLNAVRAAVQEMKSLQSQLRNSDAELEGKREALQQSQDTITSLQNEVSQLTELIQSEKDNVTSTQGKLSAASDTIAALEKELLESRQHHSDLSSAHGELKDSAARTNDELSARQQEIQQLQQELVESRHVQSQQLALLGTNNPTDADILLSDPSSRVDCIRSIRGAIAALGQDNTDIPADEAILRAAEAAAERQRDLESARADLERQRAELEEARDALQRERDELDAELAQAKTAIEDGTGEREQLQAVLDSAMEKARDQAEALRAADEELAATKASEARYRALVGEDLDEDAPEDGTPRAAAAPGAEDPSTRADCLRGIDGALAALGADADGTPAGEAIVRAAEAAAERQRDLESARADLERQRAELEEARDALQRERDELDAELAQAKTAIEDGTGEREQLQAVLDSAMEKARDQAEALRAADEELAATKASEARYRALVGEDLDEDAPEDGTPRAAAAPGAEDPSTRADCLRGIDGALAALGADADGTPAGEAIVRAAEAAAERQRDLESARADLERQRAELEEARDALQRERDELDAELAQAKTAIEDGTGEREQLQVDAAALTDRVASLEDEVEELRRHDERWSVEEEDSEPVTTQHTKVFDGDDWGCVLEEKPHELRHAFVYDAAQACHVGVGDITGVEMVLGSLHVSFDVTHSANVGKDELDARIAQYPFRSVLQVYANRHAPKTGADALEEREFQAVRQLEWSRRHFARVSETMMNEYEERLFIIYDAFGRRLSQLMLSDCAVDNIKAASILGCGAEEVSVVVASLKSQVATLSRFCGSRNSSSLERPVAVEALRRAIRELSEKSGGDDCAEVTLPALLDEVVAQTLETLRVVRERLGVFERELGVQEVVVAEVTKLMNRSISSLDTFPSEEQDGMQLQQFPALEEADAAAVCALARTVFRRSREVAQDGSALREVAKRCCEVLSPSLPPAVHSEADSSTGGGGPTTEVLTRACDSAVGELRRLRDDLLRATDLTEALAEHAEIAASYGSRIEQELITTLSEAAARPLIAGVEAGGLVSRSLSQAPSSPRQPREVAAHLTGYILPRVEERVACVSHVLAGLTEQLLQCAATLRGAAESDASDGEVGASLMDEVQVRTQDLVRRLRASQAGEQAARRTLEVSQSEWEAERTQLAEDAQTLRDELESVVAEREAFERHLGNCEELLAAVASASDYNPPSVEVDESGGPLVRWSGLPNHCLGQSAQLKQVTDMIASLEEEVGERGNENESLRVDIERLHEENESVRERADVLAHDRDAQQAEMTALMAELESEREAHQSTEQQRKELEESLSQLQADLVAVEDARISAEAYVTTLQEKVDTNDTAVAALLAETSETSLDDVSRRFRKLVERQAAGTIFLEEAEDRLRMFETWASSHPGMCGESIAVEAITVISTLMRKLPGASVIGQLPECIEELLDNAAAHTQLKMTSLTTAQRALLLAEENGRLTIEGSEEWQRRSLLDVGSRRSRALLASSHAEDLRAVTQQRQLMEEEIRDATAALAQAPGVSASEAEYQPLTVLAMQVVEAYQTATEEVSISQDAFSALAQAMGIAGSEDPVLVVDEALRALDTSQTEVDNLSAEVEQLRKKVHDISEKSAADEVAAGQLRDRLDNAEEQVTMHAQRVTDMDEQLRRFSEFITDLAGVLMPSLDVSQDAETALGRLLQAADAMRNDTHKAQHTEESLRQNLTHCERQLAEKEAAYIEICAALRAAEKIAEDLRRETHKQLQVAHETENALRGQLSELSADRQWAERAMGHLQLALDVGVPETRGGGGGMVGNGAILDAMVTKAEDLSRSTRSLAREVDETTRSWQVQLDRVKGELQGSREERDRLERAANALVSKTQGLLEQYSAVRRQFIPDGDNTLAVEDIVDMCFQQLERKERAIHSLEDAAAQAKTRRLQESLSVEAHEDEVRRLKLSIASLEDNLAEKRHELGGLRDGAAASQRGLRDLETQVRSALDASNRIVAEQLAGKLPPMQATSAGECLGAMQQLVSYLAERCNASAAPSAVEELQATLSSNAQAIAQEAMLRTQALQSFRVRIVPLVGDRVMQESREYEASGTGRSSLNDRVPPPPPPHVSAKLVTLTANVVEDAQKAVEEGVEDITTILHGISAPRVLPTVNPETGTLRQRVGTLTALAKDMEAKVSAIQQVLADLSKEVGASAIPFSASPEEWEAWARRVVSRVQDATAAAEKQRTQLTVRHDEHEQLSVAFLEAVADLIHRHGGHVTLYEETTPYHADPLSGRRLSPVEREQTRLLSGLTTLLDQLQDRYIALVSDWEAARARCGELEEEQLTAEDKIIELHHLVQRKLIDDELLEQSLRELDAHLDQQARELAMKYRADQDAIVRQFTDLRSAIHRKVRPSRRSHSSRAAHTASTQQSKHGHQW